MNIQGGCLVCVPSRRLASILPILMSNPRAGRRETKHTDHSGRRTKKRPPPMAASVGFSAWRPQMNTREHFHAYIVSCIALVVNKMSNRLLIYRSEFFQVVQARF